MTFHVYIYGNSVGVVDLTYDGRNYHFFWQRGVLSALKRVGASESCMAVMKEMFENGDDYEAFGDGIGELRVV